MHFSKNYKEVIKNISRQLTVLSIMQFIVCKIHQDMNLMLKYQIINVEIRICQPLKNWLLRQR